MHLGTNPGDLAERMHFGSNPGDLAERAHTWADHDLDMAMTEGSLAVIRERYIIPVEYGLHVPQPRQRPYSLDTPDMCISVDAPEAIWGFRLNCSAHPIGNASPYLSEEESVLVLTRRYKSRSKGKELAAPSEELDTPAESEEGGASLVHRCPRSMKDLFKMKVHKDDTGYYTLQMSDLGHQDPNKEMKA
ncbi:hypothetical protein B296_00019388 [Ensete ventricosum]|uniref:Uncharacterized protein n=1 Tax=Ensete ventricosum TaxID=4639 RepID=A0A426ZK39_ENSVE|nr:hypothetical protein B296_00019388 [Ensete ventricosum]